MPTYALIGRDGQRGGELRKLHRQAHLAGLEDLVTAGRIRHAGPLLADDGRPLGSLIVFDAPDLASARAIVERDAYVVEGIFERTELYETAVVFPK